jgi:fibronectin type 3 domain-containing protein
MGSRPKLLLIGLLTVLVVGLVWFHRKAAPHSVTLTWHAPPPKKGVTVVGYNVYRRAGDGAPFVRIATQVSGQPYEDRIVNSDRTYFYVVTTVDQSGRESRFSAEVKAEIP